MGSFHIWMARHLLAHRPRQIMISNGQQTLGVALPWAIAACLAEPSRKVGSVSGDGGFLFSAVELETAVRLKCNFVHIVWIDGSYDMVRFQQVAVYGREPGVRFGPVDVVKFAESMGARGFHIGSTDEIEPVLKKAMTMDGPVLIGVPVDYRDHEGLMAALHADMCRSLWSGRGLRRSRLGAPPPLASTKRKPSPSRWRPGAPGPRTVLSVFWLLLHPVGAPARLASSASGGLKTRSPDCANRNRHHRAGRQD